MIMLQRRLPLLWLVLPFLFISCDNEDEQEPLASFTVNKTSAMVGETITFTNKSVDASTYEWNFGDGGATVANENPTYSYNEVGVYTVTLKAIGEGGTSTSSIDITIEGEPRIIPGVRIDQYEVLEYWQNVLYTIASDYYLYNSYDLGDGYYFHIVVMESEQLTLFLLSTSSTKIQETDYVYYVAAWGDYEGKTPEGIKVGSTLTTVTTSYGTPDEIDEEDAYVLYWYDDEGVMFYAENNIVLEIDVYPVSKKVGNKKNLNIGFLRLKKVLD